jgi:hypothetical protein
MDMSPIALAGLRIRNVRHQAARAPPVREDSAAERSDLAANKYLWSRLQKPRIGDYSLRRLPFRCRTRGQRTRRETRMPEKPRYSVTAEAGCLSKEWTLK